MSDETNSTDPDLKAIETALGSLVPAQSRIDRDRVMFRAGQASVRRPRTGLLTWSAIAASLALVVVCEVLLTGRRPLPPTVVVIREPAAPPIESRSEPAAIDEPIAPPIERYLSLGQTAYERLAAQVLRYGLDGLPASPAIGSSAAGSRPGSAGQMLQEELRKLLEPGGPS